MTRIILNNHHIENLKLVCPGSEALIFQKNDCIYKVLKQECRTSTKKAKIEILANCDKSYLVKPRDTLYDENDCFIGYTMELISKHQQRHDLLEVLLDGTLSLAERIHIINCLNFLIEDLNKDDIYIDDFTLNNFLLNHQYRLKFIDTDNFIVGPYDSETKPDNSKALSDDLTPLDRQRFCFMMFALRFIINPLDKFGYNLSLLTDLTKIKEEIAKIKLPAKLTETVNVIVDEKNKPNIVDDLHLLSNDNVPYLYPTR